MTLWLRVRRVHACVAVVCALAASLLLTGDLALPIPSLRVGSTLALPFAFLLPLAVATVVAYALGAGDPWAEAVACRPMRLLDTAYALAVTALALGACGLLWAADVSDTAPAAGRNALGYVGLTLLGRRLVGPHAAPILPVGFVLFTALFGVRPDVERDWWAWPLADASDSLSWLFAGALLLLGAAVSLLRSDAYS